MKIDAFIIGVQKAGTTYLKYLLSQHPDIDAQYTQEFSFFHEPHYSSKKNINSWIKEHFGNNLNTNNHKLAKNVGVFSSVSALKRIKIHNPEIKIIIVLRHPVDRVISAYYYCLSRGLELNKNFSKAIRENNRYEDDQVRYRSCNYIDLSNYSKHLKNIYKIFKKENVIVINFEMLKSNPKSSVSTIFKFMGLKSRGVKIHVDKVVNKGKTAQNPFLNRYRLIKNTLLNRLWKKIPVKIRVKIMNFLLNLNYKSKNDKINISKTDQAFLEKTFQGELDNLKKNFDINF